MTISHRRARPSGIAIGAATALVLALGLLGGPATQADPAAPLERLAERTTPTERAATRGSVKVSPERPMTGERTRFSGKLRGKARRVTLQRKKGGRWITAGQGKVTRKSTYRVNARVRKSGRYRAKAAGFTSRTVKVKVVPQSAALTVTPPFVVGIERTVAATVSPARKGRSVALQRRTDNTWSTVVTRTTDAAGSALLPLVGIAPGTASYRVVASRFHKSTTVTSAAATVRTARTTELLSPGVTAGEEAFGPVISSDGRWVAFTTGAQLLGTDTDAQTDAYLFDRTSGVLTHLLPTANSHTSARGLSADGRFVLLQSSAANLLGEPDYDYDVFVLDRSSGALDLISATASEEPGDDDSYAYGISDDGRFVAYASTASDLVTVLPPADTTVRHAYVHDRTTGTNRPLDRVGLGWADSNIYGIALSRDGSAVAFQNGDTALDPGHVEGSAIFGWQIADNGALSGRTNLTPDVNSAHIPVLDAGGDLLAFVTDESLALDDTNGQSDVYVRTGAGVYELTTPTGPGDSSVTSMSADGRYVAIYTENPLPGDTNGSDDVVIWDRLTTTAHLVTRGGPGHSGEPQLSRDASVVAFSSEAAGLAPGATGNYNVFATTLR